MKEETKQSALEWIKAGKPCVYRYGLGWKGASARPISQEEALKKLPSYSFGVGFYSLSWIKFNNEDALEFNELSENDMY